MTHAEVSDTDTTHNGIDKISRYNWSDPRTLGEFRLISKKELNMDADYQRIAGSPKVLAIARDFLWPSFGCLIVAEREDGSLWTVDGNHRKCATMRRSDIDMLPCIVFKSKGKKDEAEVFLTTNKSRNPMTAVQSFNALLVKEDRAALVLHDLAHGAGRKINKSSNPNSFSAVGAMLKILNLDEHAARRVWSVLVDVCEGAPIHNELLLGMFTLERWQDGKSVSDTRWRKRAIRIGHEELIKSIQRAKSYHAKGGERVYAGGIAKAMNKSIRKEPLEDKSI